MKITKYINTGNSFPVILEDNGKKYFVKLRAGMSGKYALVSEWFGNKLGNQLNIKTQSPTWVKLDKTLNTEGIYIEVKELIAKSLGTNIGFQYLETAKDVNIDSIKMLDKKTATDIFLFDLIMINIDRTSNNNNLMQNGNELISVDYESSLLLSELIEGKNLLNNPRILQCFRDNPLYSDTTDGVIKQFIDQLNQVEIKDIIDEIPSELLSEMERKTLTNGIEEKRKNGWLLHETIHKLRGLDRETKEIRKRRANKNQEDFRKRMKGDEKV